MSKTDNKSLESVSSRDMILSRYQNIKNLLISKQSIPIKSDLQLNTENMIQKTFSIQKNEPSVEEDSKLNNLISLCSEIQQRIKEKIAPRSNFFWNCLEKPILGIFFVEKTEKNFKVLEKPKVCC